MGSDIELSVIVPCLDEEDNISDALDLLRKNLEGINYEVIVIDDQSTDNTASKAREWIVSNKVNNYQTITKDLSRRGYGAVIKFGLAYSTGQYVTFYSADMADPVYLLPQMLETVRRYDLVQVSRYQNSKDANSIPFKYKFYQFFYRICVRIAIGENVSDSTYAFKMFDKKKLLSLGLTSNRFSISPEIFFKAHLAGYAIAFIEGAQTYRQYGQSKFIFRKEGLGFIWCLIRAFLHRTKIAYWF
jgi:glycosyltransferase involved in cell wall biosynthesis